MSPLVTYIVNMGIVIVVLAGGYLYTRWILNEGVKIGRELEKLERQRAEAQKSLAETRSKYPPSYAVSE